MENKIINNGFIPFIKKHKEKVITLGMALVAIIVFLVIFLVNKNSIIHNLDINFMDGKAYIEVLKGLGNTLLITVVSFIMGVLIGTILCLIEGLESNNTFIIILKKIAKIYISIFRGTPMIVQLLIIYFVIFAFYSGDPLYVAIIAFGLNSGAYVSEILRGGITAVPKGQMEAGRALGLSYPAVMIKIILPQAIKNALPSLGNELITLLKETSIVGFVGAVDLTLAFRKIANATYDFNTVYITMGITYFILVLLVSFILKKIEGKLMKHVRG